MTREEAIELIERMSMAFVPTDQYGDYDDPEPYEEAVNMAIEALSAERTGEWLHEELIPNTVGGHVHGECSVFHAVRIVDNYCPNCGAKMKGGTENE